MVGKVGQSSANPQEVDNPASVKYNDQSFSSPTSIAAILNTVSIESEPTPKQSSPFLNFPPGFSMLLLTPYLHLPPPISSLDGQLDPFEPFGRQLSEYHKRVVHMPYVSKLGVTKSHLEMIEKCQGVLLVICDSSASKAYGGKERLDKVQDQEDFAMNVADLAMSLEKPNLLLVVGLDKGAPQYLGHRLDIKTWEDLEKNAKWVFPKA